MTKSLTITKEMTPWIVSWLILLIGFVAGYTRLQATAATALSEAEAVRLITAKEGEKIGELKTDIAVIKNNVENVKNTVDDIKRRLFPDRTHLVHND